MTERRKYIIWNGGAWLATLVAGMFLIIVLRQFGAALAARHEAQALLTQAHHQLKAGDAGDAQRSIVNALAVTTAIAPNIVQEFGAALLGMPALQERLQKIFESRRPPDDILAEFEFLLGDPRRALEPLQRYAASAGRLPGPYLWLARLYIENGDFFAARTAFDTYRMLNKSLLGLSESEWIQRNANEGPPIERAWKLFHVGLWAEIPHVLPADIDVPERLFFRALRYDLDGNREKALEIYGELLTERPTHLLALKRVRFLAKQRNN